MTDSALRELAEHWEQRADEASGGGALTIRAAKTILSAFGPPPSVSSIGRAVRAHDHAYHGSIVE